MQIKTDNFPLIKPQLPELSIFSPKREDDSPIIAVMCALACDYTKAEAILAEYNMAPWLYNRGPILKALQANGWKPLSLSKDARAERRRAIYRAAHMPDSPVVCILRTSIVYVNKGIQIARHNYSSKYGLKTIQGYLVPKASDETVEAFWDRCDRSRENKYGKVWEMRAGDYARN